MIPQPVIRSAIPTDIAELHALVESAYRGDTARKGWTHEADLLDGQRTDAAMLTSIVADPDQRILVALSSASIIGCVQVSKQTSNACYLGLLTVDPPQQGSGLGSLLIAAAEDYATREFGARCMEMTVIRQRHELIAYYCRRGYVATGEERPFPLDDPRFGLPRTRELGFVVLAKRLA